MVCAAALGLMLMGCGAGSPATPATPGVSKWVYYDNTGKLTYMPLDTQGDQIMDFSSAGYEGGGVTIPTATVAASVSPSGHDDTAAIQAAINTVSGLTLNTTTGLRGAVLLAPGNFTVSGSIIISASGVVLRGSGSGSTTITMTAEATPYPLVVIAGAGSPVVVGTPTAITDSYVPAGTTTLDVASTAGFSVGTNIEIHRPVTTNWVHFMGMDTLVLNGVPETWLAVGDTSLRTQRTITAISGQQITLDAPMSDSIDSTYENPPGGTLNAYTFTGRISQVGVESFSVIAPAVYGVPDTPSYQLVSATAAINSWVRNISAQDTLASVYIGTDCKQVTVSNMNITHTVTQTGSARFYEYYADSATQVLFDTVSSTGDHITFFSTSSATQGPTVLRNGSFNGDGNVEPHQRWATGLLIENTTVTGSGEIHLIDRGTDGTGHGWAIGWGVVWNSTATTFIIQHPPGSENWCIGCIGAHMEEAPPGSATVLTEGHFDSSGTQVTPSSLYQAQLTQRLAH
jgi:carbonic anhydrase/acetyltransferase-like protein (isoleucine patch superfamily)